MSLDLLNDGVAVTEQLAECRGEVGTEAEMIDLAKNGCMRSLNTSLKKYRPRIYWFVRRMGISRHHDIEGLTQETLIQVQKSIPRFEGRSKS